MTSPTAIIAGGGIGGLATAVGLLRCGWRVTVLERSSGFGELGAGFGLTANGLAALRSLGLEDAARAASHPLHVGGTRDERGRFIIRMGAPSERNALNGMHRERLHGLLRSAAADASLVPGAVVESVDPPHDGRAMATVRVRIDGRETSLESDLVVGADGVRSAVRAAVAPEAVVRYSGMSSWRGIVEEDELVPDTFTIVWGRSAEFGAVRIDARRVYWYGYVRMAERTTLEDERAAAIERFAGWAEPVLTLIGRTPRERLLRHDVHSLDPAPRRYHRGRTVLVGDAAHAMLPTMGQGVNLALEDAATLGALLPGDGTDVSAALARYEELRHRRTHDIARRSALIGRVGSGLGSRPLIALRNAALRAAPAKRLEGAGDVIFGWEPPSAPSIHRSGN
jgi:2-polyprenyl-6-methoxyphenol hydroxylase-like FAD-dependent oxidoreductase